MYALTTIVKNIEDQN